MSLGGTETELREWLDRLAIKELIHRYSDAVTRADWDQCEALFLPDAIWESPATGLHFDDRAAFMGMLRQTSASDLLIQTPHASVVELRGSSEAKATTTVHELTRGHGAADSDYGARGQEINFEQYGVYFDDVAKIDGGWKFTHRVFVPIYINTGCVTGNVLTTRPELVRPR